MGRIDYLDDPEAPRANSIVPSVNVVVIDERGRVLLIRRTDNGNWALPGGAIDIGESISDAALRETREETGIDVELTGLVGVCSNPHHVIEYTSDGEVRQEFSVVLAAGPIGGQLTPSDESSEVDWVEPAKLPGLTIHPSMRQRIEHALDPLARRPHIG